MLNNSQTASMVIQFLSNKKEGMTHIKGLKRATMYGSCLVHKQLGNCRFLKSEVLPQLVSSRASKLLLVLLLPIGMVASAQTAKITNNGKMWVAPNQKVGVIDGIKVVDQGEVVLPTTLQLSDGYVKLGSSTATYKVHDVPASANAVFFASIQEGKVGLTIKNGSSGISDYSLKLKLDNSISTSSVPLIWEISQPSGNGYETLTFSWDSKFEPVNLPSKRLYVFSSGSWKHLDPVNITTGPYTLSYTGYNESLASKKFTIATGLTASITSTSPTCGGGLGSIMVNASGGIGPRLFRINNGGWQSGSNFNGLTEGSYSVQVKDDTGDMLSFTVNLVKQATTLANISGNTNICYGLGTTLTATGGVYYVWANGLGNNAAITVAPTNNTTYSVTVTEANGCISTASVTVTVFSLNVSLTATNAYGVNDADGIVCGGSATKVTASGGVSYLWSDGSTNATLQLPTGCYSSYGVTVTDGAGCKGFGKTLVTAFSKPDITLVSPLSTDSGTHVTISGSNMSDVNSVLINGQISSVLMKSASEIKVSAPQATTIQTLSLTSLCGTFDYDLQLPAIIAVSPSSGPVGTLITLTGMHLDQVKAVKIGVSNAAIIKKSPGSLLLTVMPGTTGGTITVEALGGTLNSGQQFSVSETPYPYFQQGNKVVGSDGQGNGEQGTAVAISADGKTAVIGGQFDNSNVGSIWIFVKVGNSWVQQGGKLSGTGVLGSPKLGKSVAISADGNTVVVGGPGDGNNTGAIWVFKRTGTTWSQFGPKLTGINPLGAPEMGTTVAISGNGRTIAAGGIGDDGYSGAFWLFELYENNWISQGKYIGSGAVGKARQGNSVSINHDGNMILIGGHQDDNRKGAIWMFTKSDCNWVQQGNKITSGSTNQSWFGYSLSVSADGNIALIGGPNDSSLKGASWIYKRNGNSWTQEAKLVGTTLPTSSAQQGYSVSLTANGQVAMIGGLGDESNKGAFWIFKKSNNIWSQQGSKVTGSGAVGNAKQGTSLSVSSIGTDAIVGGPYDSSRKGASWFFASSSASISDSDLLSRANSESSEISGFYLGQNTPNPTTGKTTIEFSVPGSTEGEWLLSNSSGIVILNFKKTYDAGMHLEEFDLRNHSGIIYYQLKTEFGSDQKKMLIIR